MPFAWKENWSTFARSCLLAALLPPFAARAGDGDWQQWSEVTYSQNLGYGLDAGVRYEPRLDEDFSRYSYYELEPFINWRYSPRWDFMVSYERDEFLEPQSEDEPETEIDNLATAAAQLKIPLNDWYLTNRMRTEWIVPESDQKDWSTTYRNRTGLATTWRWGSKELVPYIFEEWFYNFQEGQFIQNRAGIGLGIPIVPHWMASVYFMRFDERTMQGWEWHPVLGVQVNVQF